MRGDGDGPSVESAASPDQFGGPREVPERFVIDRPGFDTGSVFASASKLGSPPAGLEMNAASG